MGKTEERSYGYGVRRMSHFIKNPDEIIHQDVKMVHYETMEEGRAVWLGIYLNNGKIYHLNIGGDNLYVNYSYEGSTNEQYALNALDKLYEQNNSGMEQLSYE